MADATVKCEQCGRRLPDTPLARATHAAAHDGRFKR